MPNVILLSRVRPTNAQHPEQVKALVVGSLSPEVKQGKFVGIINEIAAEWRLFGVAAAQKVIDRDAVENSHSG